MRLLKPCAHDLYDDHVAPDSSYCEGGTEATTVDLLAALEARGFVERFPKEDLASLKESHNDEQRE